MFDLVPNELRQLNQWICWHDENGNKIPKVAETGANAASTNPADWCDFATAAAASVNFTGLGFVFRQGGDIVGMDLDSCLTESGELQSWAMPILTLFNPYAEISPSGRGIKLWMRGDISKAVRSKWFPLGKPERTEKHPPAVEIYSWGRYFTVTGNHWPASPLEVADCQTGLDFLIGAHFSAPLYTPNRTYQSSNGTGDVMRRAESYLAKIPGAVSGQNGHDATFKVACHLTRGFSLGFDDAMTLISGWNQSCEPPWEDRDLERKVTQAITKSTLSEGYLLGENRTIDADSGVNLSGILNTRPSGASTTDQSQPVQPGIFSSDFYDVPGLIGEMVKHHCGHAPRPRPELSLAASIALVGTITGRKIRTKSGMRTNIYCVGLAPSGSGKERPRNNNLMAFTEAGLPHFLGSENPASDAALIGELDENPAMLIQIDEVSRYFATIKTAGNNSSHLRNIFTRFLELTGQSENPCWRPKGYADSKKSKTIAFPHLCIYGTSTAEGFWSSVQSSDAVDGFLARMMVIEADSKYPRLRQTETAETPQIVLDIMRDWDQFSPGYGNLKNTVQQTLIVPFDSAAEDRLLEQSTGIEDRLETESDDQRAIWTRTAALATKLSLIFAASRGPESLLVTLADANAAVKLANWCTRLLIRRVFTHVTENDYERAKKRMMQIIRQAGSISQSDLTRKTQWIRNSRERREVTQELLEMGLVELIPGVAGISASMFKSIE